MDTENRSHSNLNPRKIRCPLCGAVTIYSLDNPSRPFCSDRCKLVDLGQWAEQSYKIPSTAVSIENSDFLNDAEGIETKD